MHQRGDEAKPNPRDKASFLSKIIFWWAIPMIRLGYKRPIEQEDVYRVQEEDDSKLLTEKLAINWNKEKLNFKSGGSKPNLVRAIFRTFGAGYFRLGMVLLFEECFLRMSQPVCLGLLMQQFTGNRSEDSIAHAWLYATCIVMAAFLYQLCHHPFIFGVQNIAMKIRISCCGLIYQKALRLSKGSLGQTTVGQMVNLLSNDVNRFDLCLVHSHYLWVGPAQIAITTYILWKYMGPAGFCGVAVFLLYVCLQTTMSKIFSRLRLKTAGLTDERVRLMNEIVNSIHVIKMYSWEIPFKKMLDYARKKEMDVIMRTNYFRALNLGIFFSSSKLIIFLIFLTHTLSGNTLDAEKMYVTIVLIEYNRMCMTLFFPNAISFASETLISCKRLQEFLEMEEVGVSNCIEYSSTRPDPEKCKLKVNNISVKWKHSNENALTNLSFKLKAGEILNIIGGVGSGKTTLFNAILSELPIHNGNIKVNGKISFAAQEPWLFSGTIRDNILFGHDFVENKYNDVIRVCSLQRDIEIFPDGDNTLVGERGVALSGGQKARITLARALYVDADIYLLDDPLSAVDAHVGKELYEECVMKYLKDKIRILVTHQIQYLKNAEKILILNKGREETVKSYVDLTERGLDILDISVKEEGSKILPNREKSSSSDEVRFLSQLTAFRRPNKNASVLRGSATSLQDITLDNFNNQDKFTDDPGSRSNFEQRSLEMNKRNEQKKVNTELKKVGSISSKVYLGYLAAAGRWYVSLLLLLSCILAQVMVSGSNYWLSIWANQEQLSSSLAKADEYKIVSYNETGDLNVTKAINEELHYKFERETYIYAYLGMVVAVFMLSMIRTIWFYIMCTTASKNLHDKMLLSLLKAPIKFFDSHPIGQILNRFTKDMGQVDELLPPTLYDFIVICFIFLNIMIVVVSINYWILLPTLCLAVIFVFLRRFYIGFGRDIKRLEGINKSPVFSHLSTTLHGLTTIRAFGDQDKFKTMFHNHQNVHSSAWFLFLSSSRWFSLCLDLLTSIYLAIVTFSFINSSVLCGYIGFAISSSMTLSGMFEWGVRQSAEVENQMTSVERITEYSELEPEENEEKKLDIPNTEWPFKGRIAFKNVSLRYNDVDSPVLKKLNFTIKPGKKIGIVGRTGAGKTSLISCLFRMTEPEGIIEIDDVIINNIPLNILRSRISIIPQSPTLFSGTLRYNLDPFGKYKDDEIWSVLAEVQLTSIATDSGKGLEASISEGGGNLSVGQRQLLCLARAILKKSKILVMDEATANVDQKTDSLIQNTMREKFDQCTVLTVAHRLNTIIDCHKVMVMSVGRLMEYDEPYLLLRNQSSIFYSLVLETGAENSKYLHDLAKKAFHKRHPNLKIEHEGDNQSITSMKLSSD